MFLCSLLFNGSARNLFENGRECGAQAQTTVFANLYAFWHALTHHATVI